MTTTTTKKSNKKEEEVSPRGPRYSLRAYLSPTSSNTNLYFYTGKIPSKPDGDFIDIIHLKWYWDYERLEEHHGYIQWLFPVFENAGLNWQSCALNKTEAKRMREEFSVATRVVRSYRLMLNFYGLELADHMTGEIRRNPDVEFWRDRYRNLNTRSHNFLRISRIITSLGELGFAKYKKPLVDFLSNEIGKKKQLQNAKRSCNDFWMKLLKENTKEYMTKTLETAKDREPSVFFHHATKKDHVWEEYLVEEAQYREQLTELKDETSARVAKQRAEREKWEEKLRKKHARLEAEYSKGKRTRSLSEEAEDISEDEKAPYETPEELLEHYGDMEEDASSSPSTSKKKTSDPKSKKAKVE